MNLIKLVIIPINSIIKKNIKINKRLILDIGKKSNITSFTFYISLILLGFVSLSFIKRNSYAINSFFPYTQSS